MVRSTAVVAFLPDVFARVRPLGGERSLWMRIPALLGSMIVAGLTAPVAAASEPHATLVRCGSENCLRITGYRDDPASAISINGRVVPVEGERRWRAHLPVDVVRDWSAPQARTIEVSVEGSEPQSGNVEKVDLPIGMLGGVALTSLVVSAN